MTPAPLLLLWDVDGTLLQRASAEHALAMRAALEAVHGVTELERHRVEAAGRTDGAIARDLLRAAGVPAAAIDARAAEVRETCCRLFAARCPPDLSHTVAAGVRDALAALGAEHRQALVTGNYEPVARLKLERAGLGSHFAAGQGAFGSDGEDRAALPPLARRRAGGWPRERTLVIGDTPHDIACARADGVRVVAVATGAYPPEALGAADAVARTAHEVPAIVHELAARSGA